MNAALICASHTPMLMEAEFASPEICETVAKSFQDLARFITDFSPDYVIQFSPDHFRGFHYDLMPSFCVGTAANACGDWHTHAAALNVDEDLALAVIDAARAADIDVAVSFRMTVDHGFTQIWEQMFGRADPYPCVPIFVNCVAPPLPTYRRARLLGEAVGRFAAQSGKRVLFAASGGLSHDPIVPVYRTSSREQRDRLINGAKLWRESQPQREAAVRAAAAAAMRGEGSLRPLNPSWDRAILKMLGDADWHALDALVDSDVIEQAGTGANELLAWVAAAAALGAFGPYSVEQETYKDIPGWIIGMATLAARSVA